MKLDTLFHISVDYYKKVIKYSIQGDSVWDVDSGIKNRFRLEYLYSMCI